jgi:cell division protein YceG involved in septum cleavage
MKKFLLLVLVLAVIGAGIAWWGYGALSAPYRGFTGDEVFVEIPPGAGVEKLVQSYS